MKRIAGLLIIFALTAAPALFAQTEERGEVGVFADYTRLHNLNDANFWGAGGLLGFNLNHFATLEGSMAYDPERNFTTTTTTVNGPSTTTTFTRSGLRLLQGMFGPKFQTGIGPVRVFAPVKGGFLNFSTSGQNLANGFNNQIGNVTSGDTNGVVYPGGGVEFFAGRIGLRAEVGDMIYFDNGANHNLKFTIGPMFRF